MPGVGLVASKAKRKRWSSFAVVPYCYANAFTLYWFLHNWKSSSLCVWWSISIHVVGHDEIMFYIPNQTVVQKSTPDDNW